MVKLLDTLTGTKRVLVTENQRALVLEKGRFADILTAGEHRLKNSAQVHMFDLNTPEFATPLKDALFRERPELAEAHLLRVTAGDGEAKVISREGRVRFVLGPTNQKTLWLDAGAWKVEAFDITEDLAIEPKLGRKLWQAGFPNSVAAVAVPDGWVGLLEVDGAFTRVLPAGTHHFWGVAQTVKAKLVDTRWRAHDVTGQEILTKDRVTLRVNLAADFRVVDPLKAVTTVKDFEEALHRALQFAFRKTLGARTLDDLLAEKVSVDAEAADKVRAEMAEIGIELGEIALKDVILPGEMRDILNQVVAATKAAEANVIKRREETNATRSLLNTAKVMAENPVMLRLKELEALEVIAGKVERLTVHNGTNGLMNDLVKLRD